MAERKKVDVITTVALVGGIAAAGLGAFLLFKKPPGVSPGDTVVARFKFDYLGQGGDYVLLVRFGYYQPPYMPFGFDQEETLGQHILNISLPEPDTYETKYDIKIPDGARVGTYDGEGSILLPGMVPGKEWITRAFQKSAIRVIK